MVSNRARNIAGSPMTGKEGTKRLAEYKGEGDVESMSTKTAFRCLNRSVVSHWSGRSLRDHAQSAGICTRRARVKEHLDG